LAAPCGPSLDPKDPTNDPKDGHQWGPERQVRSELIRWLCTNSAAASRIDPKGIQLFAAKIIGPLDLSFCTVRFPLLIFRCCVTGEINMTSASLPGLYLNGSSVQSISADGIHVEGNVHLLGGFTAHGEVRLLGAQIGGNLDCSGGTFKNPRQEGLQSGDAAFNADGVKVDGSVFLRDGFAANGGVRLPGAQIGADLDCSGGTISELILEGANIVRHLLVALIQDGAKGKMNLTDASAAALVDNEESWPAAGNLHLDGFVYGRITVGPTDAETRLKWLALQPEFKPQPYRHIAKVLGEMGDDRGARRVLYQMEKLRRTEQTRTWRDRLDNEKLTRRSRLTGWVRYGLGRGWSLVLKATIGYGFRLQRTLICLIGLTALGTLLFGLGYLGGSMAPTERDAYASFEKQGWPPRHYQAFNPFIYALENSVPVLKLGQDSAWAPDPGPREQECSGEVNFRPWKWLARVHPHAWATPCLLRCYRWLQIVSGWMLATLFVAGVTGVVRRE
jgi:hypothetical protein